MKHLLELAQRKSSRVQLEFGWLFLRALLFPFHLSSLVFCRAYVTAREGSNFLKVSSDKSLFQRERPWETFFTAFYCRLEAISR